MCTRTWLYRHANKTKQSRDAQWQIMVLANRGECTHCCVCAQEEKKGTADCKGEGGIEVERDGEIN